MFHYLSAHLPNVWGEGTIFAFSGMDGETRTAPSFVATAGRFSFDLLIHTPRKRVLHIREPYGAEVTVKAALGDVLVAEVNQETLALTWSSWHTLIGLTPPAITPLLGFHNDLAENTDGGIIITRDDTTGDVVGLLVEEDRFSLCYGTNEDEVRARCHAGLTADLHGLIQQHISFYNDLPSTGDPADDRLLQKCISVMRVNTCSPEDAFPCHWSTPDRVPHTHMWLWDSVFHSLAMNRVNPELSTEFLQAVLERIYPVGDESPYAGMIPIQMSCDGNRARMTQPPLLAWGVLENARARGHLPASIQPLLDSLIAGLMWNLENRDSLKTGLLQWLIEEHESCRSGESGLDNSPRFDSALTMDAVDFVVFQIQDMHCLVDLLEMAERPDDATSLREKATAMEATLHEALWSEDAGMYLDRMPDGSLSPVKAVTGFLPLLLTDTPPGRVKRMIQTLESPDFAPPCPIPSIAVSDPAYSTDMWRGPVWINMNYLIIQGLRRHGEDDLAQKLSRSTIAMVRHAYETYGVIFEYYDSAGTTPPVQCYRKGPPAGTPYLLNPKGYAGLTPVRDFHWSAALTSLLILGGAPS